MGIKKTGSMAGDLVVVDDARVTERRQENHDE
jgi:hypothetical protein